MRQLLQIIIDVLMVILLPLLMLFMVTGQETHEWLGVMLALMFLFHFILNISWLKNLFRGKYPAVRAFMNLTTILLLINMILLVISGILMSGTTGYVFEFLRLQANMEFLKKLHMFSAYWGFILMTVHFGQHWNHIVGIVNRVLQVCGERRAWKTWPLRMIAFLAALCGGFAFLNQNMVDYLFLKSAGIYFDNGKAQWSYLWDCAAIMMLFTGIGYYTKRLLQRNIKGGLSITLSTKIC